MNSLKANNMMRAYKGFRGDATIQAILKQIPAELKTRLTGKELGMVMDAVNKAYHNGRASKGEIDNCDDCYWIPDADGGKGGLIPKAAISAISIKETKKVSINEPTRVTGVNNHLHEWCDANGRRILNPQHGQLLHTLTTTTTRTYTLEYSECH